MQIKDSLKPQENIFSKGDANETLSCAKFKNSIETQTKKKKNVKNLVDQNTGVWDLIEIKNYYTFLMKNQRIMQNPELIRKKKMFRKMSQFICTRTFSQCTSHHQKVMEKYGNVTNAIQNYKKNQQSNNNESQDLNKMKKKGGQKIIKNQDKNSMQILKEDKDLFKFEQIKKEDKIDINRNQAYESKGSAFIKFEQKQQQKSFQYNNNLKNMIMMMNPNILNMMIMMMRRM